MMGRKTYWHLEALRRKPTDYEIASSRLLYHPSRGFEVDVPVADWYVRHQKNSPLVLSDPEAFSDPRETTYTLYTRIQKDQEAEAGGVLESMEDPSYDAALPEAWIGVLSRIVAPLRYPVHGLQMIAAYAGQMAPGGKIVIAALFQSADEIRRLQRVAYRVRLLQRTRPSLGLDSREIWERDPIWQPMRKCIERLLVTYDWGEALVALNAVLKPLFDELFMVHLAELAARSGDPLLPRLFASLDRDCRWHRDWTRTLLRTAIAENPQNRGVIRGWIRRWHAEALQAVAPFGTIFEGGASAVGSRFAAVMASLHAQCRDYWSSADLSISPE
ncbi:MAG TPA: toluene hydroxylase [Planctomycetota bacterium]|nr:toluene hydroxylase [Planctomycetota bacterium]